MGNSARVALLCIVFVAAVPAWCQDLVEQHQSLMTDAIDQNDGARVKKLLTTPYLSVDDVAKRKGARFSCYAAFKGSFDALEALLDSGASTKARHCVISASWKEGWTVPEWVVNYHQSSGVRALESMNVPLAGSRALSAYLIGGAKAKIDPVQDVEALIGMGAPVNERFIWEDSSMPQGVKGGAPLHWLSAERTNKLSDDQALAVAKVLLAHGANIWSDSIGSSRTALAVEAATRARIPLLTLYMESLGADTLKKIKVVTLKDAWGLDAVHAASYEGCYNLWAHPRDNPAWAINGRAYLNKLAAAKYLMDASGLDLAFSLEPSVRPCPWYKRDL